MPQLDYKILGQTGVTADTDTNLYSPGAGKKAIVQVTVSNTNDSSNIKFRLAVVEAGSSPDPESYLVYDQEAVPGETIYFTGITVKDTDTIVVRSETTSNLSAGTGIIFQAFGEEQS